MLKTEMQTRARRTWSFYIEVELELDLKKYMIKFEFIK